VVRGLHGRGGAGEAKLVRCSFGAIYDVVVDARPESPTFGRWMSLRLDDQDMAHLYIPPGFLHGLQALSEVADVCYRGPGRPLRRRRAGDRLARRHRVGQREGPGRR
jgi:dTDP-4-dehydrorhamnose 3,5-epimerase